MKNIETLKRNEVVILNRDCSPMSGLQFKAGETFKFLGWYGGTGNLCRLSRVGDNAKLMVVPADIGYGVEIQASTVETVKQPEPSKYDIEHSDESGASKRVVIATVLAGKDSGEIVMHMTPMEYKGYCDGCAKMAEMYPG